jgi:hypothetical protein
MLLTISQTVPPLPGQTPDTGTPTPQTPSKKTASNEKQGTPTPSQIIPGQSVTGTPSQVPAQNQTDANKGYSVAVTKLPSVSVDRDWIDCAILILNLGLLGVGSFGVYAALKTLDEVKKQANLTQATLLLQFPPRLKVRNVVLVSANPPFHQEWFVEFTIVNTGGSTAHITHSSFNWQVFEDGLPPNLIHDVRNADKYHFSLAPGEERVLFEKIDDEDLIALFRMYGRHDRSGMIQQRTRFLYFFGHAKYQTDRLTKEREGTIRSISVCRHYNLREGRFVSVPDYEYED